MVIVDKHQHNAILYPAMRLLSSFTFELNSDILGILGLLLLSCVSSNKIPIMATGTD